MSFSVNFLIHWESVSGRSKPYRPFSSTQASTHAEHPSTHLSISTFIAHLVEESTSLSRGLDADA